MVLDAEFASGERRAAEAHQFEVELRRGRLGHPAHPQPWGTGLVALLAQHVTKPIVDGVHRHQAGGGHRVGEHGGGRVAEARTHVRFQGFGERLAADESGRRQRDPQGLGRLEVFASQDGPHIEANILEVVRQGVANGVGGGRGDRHGRIPEPQGNEVERSPEIVAVR